MTTFATGSDLEHYPFLTAREGSAEVCAVFIAVGSIQGCCQQ